MSPAPAGPYYPTNALVAVAWLGRRVAGLVPGMVATRLPRDLSTWADLGFVQATVVTGCHVFNFVIGEHIVITTIASNFYVRLM